MYLISIYFTLALYILWLSWIYLFFLLSLIVSCSCSFPSFFFLHGSGSYRVHTYLYPISRWAGFNYFPTQPFDLLTSLPEVNRGLMEPYSDTFGILFFTYNRHCFHELAFSFR